MESDNNTVGSVLYQNGTLGHLLFTSEGVGANQSFKLYCTNGTLDLGDPNEYGGVIRVTNKKGEISEIHTTHAYVDGNFRGLGVADAAYAIRNRRPARCSGEMNRHVLEMALGILEDSATGQVPSHADHLPAAPAFRTGLHRAAGAGYERVKINAHRAEGRKVCLSLAFRCIPCAKP